MNNKARSVAQETIEAIKGDGGVDDRLSDWQKFEIFAKKALK